MRQRNLGGRFVRLSAAGVSAVALTAGLMAGAPAASAMPTIAPTGLKCTPTTTAHADKPWIGPHKHDAPGLNGYRHDEVSLSVAQADKLEAQTTSRLADLGLTDRSAAITDTRKKRVIKVHWHQLMTPKGKGSVPKKHRKRQMAVLNRAYKKYGFRFKIVSFEKVKAKKFKVFNYSKKEGTKVFRNRNKGKKNALNLYTANLPKNLLGVATLPGPWSGRKDSNWAVFLPDSLPGGSAAPYNKGDTATHEIGHWLGLYHTFENGCKKPGDRVSDTPFEAKPQYRCKKRNSCKKRKGMDPIHNFMDYTPDACMNRLTKGQGKRMRVQFAAWRALKK